MSDLRSKMNHTGHPANDRLIGIVNALSREMTRRSFLGVIGKGTAVVVAAVAGILPLGSALQSALACYYCYGCYGYCGCGNYTSNCWYEIVPGTIGLCARKCQLYYTCCFVVVASGPTTIANCPCLVYDCTDSQ